MNYDKTYLMVFNLRIRTINNKQYNYLQSNIGFKKARLTLLIFIYYKIILIKT